MEGLKHCPFCGNPARIVKTNLGFGVECSANGHIHNTPTTYDTVDEAQKNWQFIIGQGHSESNLGKLEA